MKTINNNHPMAKVIATTRKTVDYAVAYPETFRPGTDSYKFFENMTGVCSTGLEHFTDCESAEPLLEILRLLFAQTDRPEAKAFYAHYIGMKEKPWYNPMISKIMMMHAIDDLDESNPHAAAVQFMYGFDVFFGRGWFHRDEARGMEWIGKAEAGGFPPAREFIEVTMKYRKGKKS